jgi:hypothetical protein
MVAYLLRQHIGVGGGICMSAAVVPCTPARRSPEEKNTRDKHIATSIDMVVHGWKEQEAANQEKEGSDEASKEADPPPHEVGADGLQVG